MKKPITRAEIRQFRRATAKAFKLVLRELEDLHKRVTKLEAKRRR